MQGYKAHQGLTQLPIAALSACQGNLCKMALTENSSVFYYTRYMLHFFTLTTYWISTLMGS